MGHQRAVNYMRGLTLSPGDGHDVVAADRDPPKPFESGRGRGDDENAIMRGRRTAIMV